MTIAVPEQPNGDGGLVPLPCHHGCTSRMQEQTVYGARTAERPPDTFDPGEMGACVTAVGEATKLLNGYHHYVETRVGRTVAAHSRAVRALDALERLDIAAEARIARAELDAVQDRYADLPPAERRSVGPWAKVAAYTIIGLIAGFDVWYFYNTFVNILQLDHTEMWWLRFIGGLPGLALAAGLILVGKVVAAPIWRTVRAWRRPRGPEEPPLGRFAAFIRFTAILAFPAVVLFVFTVWAYLRPIYDADTTAGFPAWAVAALLLALAFIGIVAEVLVHSPYDQEVGGARRRLREAEQRYTELQDASAAALAELETAWRGLRGDGHGMISLVRAELGRAWENTILPARLRHLRTGDYAPETHVTTELKVEPDDSASELRAEMTAAWQFFTGLPQPVPAPGPLATVIENVAALDPAALRHRRARLVSSLNVQFVAKPDAHREESDDGR